MLLKKIIMRIVTMIVATSAHCCNTHTRTQVQLKYWQVLGPYSIFSVLDKNSDSAKTQLFVLGLVSSTLHIKYIIKYIIIDSKTDWNQYRRARSGKLSLVSLEMSLHYFTCTCTSDANDASTYVRINVISCYFAALIRMKNSFLLMDDIRNAHTKNLFCYDIVYSKHGMRPPVTEEL